jgi:2Fe-2S ferredoxin
MTTITFNLHDDRAFTVEARDGSSLMETARANDVPGIVAECGGAMACATCHVVVDPAWVERVGVATGSESDMLELVPERHPGSRLSCQVKIAATMGGAVVHVPLSQF